MSSSNFCVFESATEVIIPAPPSDTLIRRAVNMSLVEDRRLVVLSTVNKEKITFLLALYRGA